MCALLCVCALVFTRALHVHKNNAFPEIAETFADFFTRKRDGRAGGWIVAACHLRARGIWFSWLFWLFWLGRLLTHPHVAALSRDLFFVAFGAFLALGAKSVDGACGSRRGERRRCAGGMPGWWRRASARAAAVSCALSLRCVVKASGARFGRGAPGRVAGSFIVVWTFFVRCIRGGRGRRRGAAPSVSCISPVVSISR